jgi:hypothetical protein
MSLAALYVFSASLFAQSYLPLFPREGAKKILENDYVDVWDVIWVKGERAALHEQRLDQVSVTLTEGVVTVTRPDKTSRIEFRPVGSVSFESKGRIAAEEGVSDRPSRAIVVELKSRVAPRLPVIAGIPGQFPRPGAVKLFENDRVTVWNNTWKAMPRYRHAHYAHVVAVFLEGGTLLSIADDGERREIPREPGEVLFSSARSTPHEEDTLRGSPRAIFIELK